MPKDLITIADTEYLEIILDKLIAAYEQYDTPEQYDLDFEIDKENWEQREKFLKQCSYACQIVHEAKIKLKKGLK